MRTLEKRPIERHVLFLSCRVPDIHLNFFWETRVYRRHLKQLGLVLYTSRNRVFIQEL